jgi:hypothetical protein
MKRWLRTGAPYSAIAAVAAIGLAGLILAAALRETDPPRSYAHIHATEGECRIEPDRSRDAIRCERVSPNTYRVTFSRSLEGRAPVATLETCCPGQILASVDSDRSVLVALRPERYPVLAFVVVD